MMVIMLGGKARVGKTTVAKWFGEFLYNKGYSPVNISFAAMLKQEVERTGLTKEKNPEEYRLACQLLGSTKRELDPDYWVHRFEEKLQEVKEQDITNLRANPKKWHEKCVIVDDCRYLNEVNYGRKIGALEVFIAHGSRELWEHTGKWRDHESESMANKIEAGELDYQDMFHYRLFNEGTEDQFRVKLVELFQDWLDYLQADDKEMCGCIWCLKTRNDVPMATDDIENMLNSMHKIEENTNDEDD